MGFEYKDFVRECISCYRKTAFSLDEIKQILIVNFKIKSLRYSHVSKDYILTFVKELEHCKYGSFVEKDQKFVLDTKREDILEIVDELQDKTKQKKAVDEVADILKAYKED